VTGQRTQAADEAYEDVPTAPSTSRPTRNDACHCGSNQKYKFCHLTADEIAWRSSGDDVVDLQPSRAARRLTRSRRIPRVRGGEEKATSREVV